MAIAVKDLEAAIVYYQGAFGAAVPTARSSRATGGGGAHQGGRTPASSSPRRHAPTPPIAKSIEKRRRGLHHVGYQADDCAAALAAMVAAGATAIDRGPPAGQPSTTVAFVHPKGSFGTLIELVQE